LNKPTMSKNMTEAHLEAVMNALPEKMEEEELRALTLTIYSAYQDDMTLIAAALLRNFQSYAMSQGIPAENVALTLHMVADAMGENENNNKQTTH